MKKMLEEVDIMSEKKRSHLNERWYVVGQHEDNYVMAGHVDPTIGIFVCGCENWALDVDIDTYSDRWDIATPQELAQRIADDHNEALKLRKLVAELEKQLEAQKTVKQQIEELYG
jgi:hypothetical protein